MSALAVTRPDSRSQTFTWTTVGGAEVSPVADLDHMYGLKSLEVTGTIGAPAATLVAQHSDDGQNWATLNDQDGVAISLTAVGTRIIKDHRRFFRLSTSGGTGTNLTVVLKGVFMNRGVGR